MGWRASLLATIAVPLCLVAELLPIRPYTTADGLAGDRIGKIAVDSRGFVASSRPRAAEAPSRRICPDTPRENNVTALMRDSGGGIWCGTRAGCSKC
jgi:hypothetical protein